jgi:hypothetical protein
MSFKTKHLFLVGCSTSGETGPPGSGRNCSHMHRVRPVDAGDWLERVHEPRPALPVHQDVQNGDLGHLARELLSDPFQSRCDSPAWVARVPQGSVLIHPIGVKVSIRHGLASHPLLSVA